MNIKVIKSKETLSVEEALNVKGGLNPSFEMSTNDCTCNCFIGNKNEVTTVETGISYNGTE